MSVHSLRELQREFRDALLSATPGDAAAPDGLAWVLEDGMAVAERIRVYRNNVTTTFIATLAATYPVIERLGGSEWFRQCARDYQRLYPSVAGDLQLIGLRFAEFLRSRVGVTEHAYFEDVARLEWAYQEVLIAAPSAPLDPALLATVRESDQGGLVFRLRPAVRLVESAFPILAIWESNQPDATAAAVSLDAGPSRVVLTRHSDGVHLNEIDPASAFLYHEFARGAHFAAAAAAFAAVYAEDTFARAFRDLIALQAVDHFTL